LFRDNLYLNNQLCPKKWEKQGSADVGYKPEAKIFTPDAQWTWYTSEFDGKDIFFGLVIGPDIELGYFSLSAIKSV
jgi:hypothetical protein